jgi:hypothetical protein
MASNRLKTRGQETQVFVSINNVVQAGSWTDILDFSLKPLMDHLQLDFLGETESQFDLQMHGHEFSFSANEEDNSIIDNLHQAVVAALDAGTTLPKVNLTVITTYRDPSISVSSKALIDCKLKVDDLAAGGRKDFNKITISGRCRKLESN